MEIIKKIRNLKRKKKELGLGVVEVEVEKMRKHMQILGESWHIGFFILEVVSLRASDPSAAYLNSSSLFLYFSDYIHIYICSSLKTLSCWLSLLYGIFTVMRTMGFVFLLLAFSAIGVVQGQLRVGFYSDTCPDAEFIVSSVVRNAAQSISNIPPVLLRLQFHDCFVEVSFSLSLSFLHSPLTLC